ncbi:ABC transporter permease [Yimella sp. cx-51]|uniref:ABC transporter permease n=1 Tax=Yimella sp. cx-51 TaxID=2770551 RepID=UPI001FCB5A7F|nr:ABC-2 family transporter protein [Yimella sp. cx-51]
MDSAYRAVLASRMRSQRSYRTNFRLDIASSTLIGLIELAEIWVLFHAVGVLGGYSFKEILLVYGIADLCFSLADLVVGHCDNLPTYLRAGTLDVFYLRPQPILAQLITSDISLKRLSRAAVAATCIVVALWLNDIDWTAAKVLLLVLSLVSATLIFTAQYIAAAGLQFFLINGAEATNAFVYGGRYASTQVASVWTNPLKVIFGFVFPMAFAAFIPSLWLLDKPGPAMFPSWLAWATPVMAAWSWGVAMLCWRWGLRHYQGGGG